MQRESTRETENKKTKSEKQKREKVKESKQPEKKKTSQNTKAAGRTSFITPSSMGRGFIKIWLEYMFGSREDHNAEGHKQK